MTNLRRTVPAVLLLSAALFVLAKTFNARDPIADWLAWRYLAVALGTLAWGVCCLSGGFAIGRRLGLHRRSARECLTQSFALGVLAFALLTVVVGLLHGLGPVSFFALPALFLAAGARPLLRFVRRYARRVRALRRGRPALATVAALYALACCTGLYLAVLTPVNVQYDARWYHLPIAEHFASSGAVGRFDEGWFLGALPHLASWLYVWPLSLPFGAFVHRLELTLHLEYLLFAATVFSLPVLVDLLVKRPRVASSWAAFFLFPGILLYDSNLGGGADHVLAFWGVPIFVALIRFWKRPTVATGVLLGAFLAGAALTKYQGIYLLAFPLGAALLRVRRAPKAVLAGAVTLIVLTSTHWLLNWLWYGNPIFPQAYGIFGGSPLLSRIPPEIPADGSFMVQGTASERAWKTLKAVATFGLEPHDWSTFHGDRPVFGALLIPALVLLPTIRRRRSVIALGVACLLGVALWFATYHQDRYLQALVPWMAACTIAILACVWRELRVARPFVVVLVALQVLACADIYFLPTHAMAHVAPLQRTMDLFTSGFRKALGERDQAFAPLAEADALLPKNAKVLVHEQHLHAGLNRPAVRDARGRQGGISYAVWEDTATVVRNLRAMGVTHVATYQNPIWLELMGDDVVYWRFVLTLVDKKSLSDGTIIARLPDVEPSARKGVGILGCTVETLTPVQLDGSWDRLRQTRCDAPTGDFTETLANVDVAITDNRRYPDVQLPGFTVVFSRDEFRVWGRNP